MTIHSTIKPSHADGFGPDIPPTVTRFEDVLAYVRTMEPVCVAAEALPDVIAILEYTREQVLKMHDKAQEIGKRLDERDADLTRREAALNIRQRAVDMILKDQPEPAPRRRFNFWR